MISLSTCWNAHRHEDGRTLAQEARQLGFECIEVSHGTRIALLPGLLEAVAAGEIRVSSLHNFCPAPVEVRMDAPDIYEPTSHRWAERDRWLSLTLKTIEMAKRFGTDRVVLHLGSARLRWITPRLETLASSGRLYSRPFTRLKLKLVARRERASSKIMARVNEAIRELIPECERHGVRLGIESRSHFEQVPNQKEMQSILREFQECPWVGAWHDFGHAQRQANLAFLDHAEFLSAIAPRLLGCHVHDVQWPARDHRAPLSTGGVDLAAMLPLLPRDIPLVWEVSPGQKREAVAEALAKWRARHDLAAR